MKKHNSEVQQHKQFVRAFEKAKKKSIGEELFQAYAESQLISLEIEKRGHFKRGIRNNGSQP